MGTMLKLTMQQTSKRSRRVRQKKVPRGASTDAATENREAVADNVNALLSLEASGAYNCEDYLAKHSFPLDVYDLLPKGRLQNVQHPGDTSIDEYCREQIVEWTFRVVDYFKIDREVVAVSLSLLDRFLAICECDRATFKLAATTTLNLAVKLLHPCKLGELGILSDLSRGEFDMSDVACMERHILQSLQWKLHPATPIAFATLLLDFIFSHQSLNLSSTDVDDLYDISSFFTELSLCDYYFVGVSPSSIALASVVNALEGMFGPENKVAPLILSAASKLKIYTGQDLTTPSHKLWELYERSEECALHNNFDPMEEEEKVSDATAAEIFVSKQQGSSHNKQPGCSISNSSPVSVQQTKHCNSMTSNELMCAMRQQTLRNGSW